MASFVQRFASKKPEGGGNSIQEEIILGIIEEASEYLAAKISQETSSVANIEAILTGGSKSIAPDKKSEVEEYLEQEIEKNSLERLLAAIEVATSTKEIATLIQQYKKLLARWSEKVSLLRSEKHLKEYLSIAATLSMLQKMLQNSEILKGKQLSGLLQSSLKSQQQPIADQARQMLLQNQKLHKQTQMLSKQLSGLEKSLLASIEALKQGQGKLSPQELQATLENLQKSLKQVQELKEKTLNGKPIDFKETIKSLQKIQSQNQQLIESGKLSDWAMQAMRFSQRPLQQTMQQIIQAQMSTLSKDAMLSRMLTPEARGQVPLPTRGIVEASGQKAAMQQVVNQRTAVSFTTNQPLELARVTSTTQAVQTPVMTGQVIEAAKHTSIVQQTHIAEQVITRVQSVPDNLVHLASATQHKVKQEYAQQQQTDTTAKQQVTDSRTPATEKAWADMVAQVERQSLQKSKIFEAEKKTWAEQCKQQISAKGAAICVCG